MGKAQHNPIDLKINSTMGEIGNIVNRNVKFNIIIDASTCPASVNWNPNSKEYIHVSDFSI